MRRSVKLGLITLVLVILAILSYVAVSDNFFFVSLDLTHDNFVHYVRDGYEIY